MSRDGKDLTAGIGETIGPNAAIAIPPPVTRRWIPQRKAEVVAAVRHGVLTLDEACERYALTVEEFLSWEEMIDRYGLQGLRMNGIQHHRHAH